MRFLNFRHRWFGGSVALSLAVIGGLCWPLLAHGKEPLRFAPLPRESPEVVLLQFLAMTQYLEQQGQPVEFVFYDQYDELLRAFQDGRVDLAYLGPLSYVYLRDRHPAADPLVRFNEADGQPSYRCVLVGFSGDRIDLARRQDLTVALTQPLSTCGYMGTDRLLRPAAGISLAKTRYRYLDSHEAVALSVLSGEFAVGGMKDDIAAGFADLGLIVLAQTKRKMPGHALVANGRTVSAEQRAELTRLLLSAPAAEYGNWGTPIRHGAQATDDADFDVIRTMRDLLPLAEVTAR